MTFLEAAVEVLRREGKALPAGRLAELALKLNLLSVVGRDPVGTMEARLEDAVEKDSARSPVVLIKPGVYGLRAYPERTVEQPAKAAAAAPKAAAAAPEPEAAEGEAPAEKKGRRRRGGRGRKKGEAAPVEAEAEAAPTEKAEAAPVEKAEEGGEGKRRRRSRRGGRGRRREGEARAESAPAVEEAGEPAVEEAAAEEPAAEEPAAEAAQAAVEEERAEDDELLDEPVAGEEHDAELDVPSGPLLAPSHGSEELTRSDEDRAVRAEIFGRREREDRGRHRRGRGRDRERGRDRDRPRAGGPAPQAQASPPAPQAQSQAQAQPQAQPPPAGGKRAPLDAVFEVLRAENRPVHARHIAEQAQRRGFLDGAPNDLVRLVRATLIHELRDREADGLRPRVRALGGGHYALGDRKLEPELAQAEREMAEKAARLRDLARTTLRRRLPRLSPAAFEALCRMLLEKLGLPQLELVRRGEGVAYFGGVRTVGVAQLKTLVAVRPGEAEISRRAVGELRAGLAARGFDEGILLAAGRASGEALAELKAGTGVTVHDGQSLAALLAKHGLGIKRALVPVEYLDLDLFAELSEG